MIGVVHSYRLLLKELPHIIDISGTKMNILPKNPGSSLEIFQVKNKEGTGQLTKLKKS